MAAALLLACACGTPDTPALSMAAKENLHTIEVALDSWAARHHDRYPGTGRVGAEGLGKRVAWPANPWTGKPMVQGTDPGDFTYSRSSEGNAAVFTGYGAHGVLLRVRLPEASP
jgi:hypothetical protein